MSPADPTIYDSERLAACYAADRPPVHAVICARLFAHRGAGERSSRALDIGCGAGVSTRALLPYATQVLGLDPQARMLRHARTGVPAAAFVRGVARALPVASGSCDIVTAAGSLNYTDVDEALAEVARVLRDGGHFAAYDFSTGRPLADPTTSADGDRGFERAFPPLPGYALDLGRLPCREHGLTPLAHERFTVQMPMTLEAYVQYLLGETNVESAIVGGLAEGEVRRICRELFGPTFGAGPRPVSFDAEFTLARKA